eukprot:CAMPEP_0182920766 /NCGR_PEP_ID=MMETSP0105_2-20130417/3705_1 /TAXON_ID=81532 ORGANISM="Acanthoeca-like sp., Strain 10tr" /NCGR_SAMPLE_ID=MMETSP0105_2 /ASSEMBLY_ACC=CAM_ASM_000205 /LENGTH=500 /DNA_ID=CAMNT_0025058219 /DNA_START=59 /DNA_END=1561 /DNA_ORIENTATION=-
MNLIIRKVRGLVVVTFLVVSSVFTSVFVLLPLLLLHPAVPRRVLRALRAVTAAWFASGALLLEMLGVSVSVDIRGATQKQLESDVRNLLFVMNHHCRLDWLFTWMIELRLQWSTSKIIVLKRGLRHLPGIGWAMQMLRYIFLHRSWSRDEERISYVLRSVQRDGAASVLLFPEGTDLTKETKAKAHQFAKDHDLPLYENVLNPRPRGFAHIFTQMRGNVPEPLTVWDVTVGYVGLPAGSGEPQFLSGVWPTRVHYRVSRWPAEQIPPDERALVGWLQDRWTEKEQLLDDFHESHGAHMMLPAEAAAQPGSPTGDTVGGQASVAAAPGCVAIPMGPLGKEWVANFSGGKCTSLSADAGLSLVDPMVAVCRNICLCRSESAGRTRHTTRWSAVKAEGGLSGCRCDNPWRDSGYSPFCDALVVMSASSLDVALDLGSLRRPGNGAAKKLSVATRFRGKRRSANASSYGCTEPSEGRGCGDIPLSAPSNESMVSTAEQMQRRPS